MLLNQNPYPFNNNVFDTNKTGANAKLDARLKSYYRKSMNHRNRKRDNVEWEEEL